MAPMISVYSSSSEMEEHSASDVYVYSTDELDDEDYVMEGGEEESSYSYSTEVPDDVEDYDRDKTVETLERGPEKSPTLVKNPDDQKGIFSSREKTPEITSPEKTSEKGMNDDIASKGLHFKRKPKVGSLVSAIVGVVLLSIIWRAWTLTSFSRAGPIIYPVFNVESVSVFPIQLVPLFNTTDQNLIAGWNIIFNVRNPTNQPLYYSDLLAEVVYSGKRRFGHPPHLSAVIPPWMAPKPSSLWSTVIRGFNQAKYYQQDLVKVTFDSVSVPVTVGHSVADSLRKDIVSGESSGFSVIMHVNVTTQVWKGYVCNNYVRPFRVDCNLNMAFLQTGGVMAASSQECKVSLMSEIEGWVWLGFGMLFVWCLTLVSALTKLVGY